MSDYKADAKASQRAKMAKYADGGSVEKGKSAQSIPLPKERPLSASAEWNNSIEGRIYGESEALKHPEGSWLRKAFFGK